MHPMQSPPLYGLDIETDTAVDGLDAQRAAVVAAALSTAEGDEVFLGEESDILRRLDRRLGQLPAGVIVTWNGRSFDLPFLAHRAMRAGIPLDLRLALHGPDRAPWPPADGGYRARWGPHAHLDGYLLYRADVRRVFGVSCGLKALSRMTGLAPVQVDYDALHELDDGLLAAYVASDARLARELVDRRLPVALASIDRIDHLEAPSCAVVPGAVVPNAPAAEAPGSAVRPSPGQHTPVDVLDAPDSA